jgi:hypothetical protein
VRIALEISYLAQAKKYLEAYNIEGGLLFNFRSMRLEVKRLVSKNYFS